MNKPNTLFYGDCLDILKNRDQRGDRYIKDESVDLIYLDPPFNSNRVYNVIFKEPNGRAAASQIKGFDDTWTWNDNVAKEYEDIKEAGGKVAETLVGLEMILGFCNMFAYLVMMASRLVEMKRVLKPTGSIYLHCDQTAGHYIKVLMDGVFGTNNFRNEIIWKRYAPHSLSKERFDDIADLIFFYSKSSKIFFNPQYIDSGESEINKRFPYIEEESGRRYQHVALEQSSNASTKGEVRNIQGKKIVGTIGWRWSQQTFDERIKQNPYLIYWTKNRRPRYKIYVDEYKGKPMGNIWDDIPYLSAGDSERLGYPTQKPEALLERIIKASSNPGDAILDPFCGCGTTISVADRLDRRWIGIDITHIAITIMKHRLGPDANYQVIGEPASLEDAQQLAKEDPFQFQLWALGLINARPEGGIKKGKDQGIDGKLLFETPTGTNIIICSVKSGHVSSRDVRDLNGTVNANKAAIGVLISMEPFTKDMRSEAAKGGFYKPKGVIGEETYPRIQLYTIEDLLSGEKVKYPVYLKDVTLPEVKSSNREKKGEEKEADLNKWE